MYAWLGFCFSLSSLQWIPGRKCYAALFAEQCFSTLGAD